MEINLQKLIKKNIETDNSTSILIVTKTQEQLLELIEKAIRYILKIPLSKSFRADPDCFGIWPEDLERNTIKIEQVHEFIRQTQLKPFRSRFKTGVIVKADKMTTEAQNALLKTLEEPSKNTILILATTQEKELLPTILSRCQILRFYSKNEDNFDNEASLKILHSDLVERFFLIENLLKQKDKDKVNEDIELLLANLLSHLRLEFLNGRNSNTEEIIKQINLIEETKLALDKNVNKRLALESLMINLPKRHV